MEEHRQHYVRCGGEKFLDLMDQAEVSVLRAERDTANSRVKEMQDEIERLRTWNAQIEALNIFLGTPGEPDAVVRAIRENTSLRRQVDAVERVLKNLEHPSYKGKFHYASRHIRTAIREAAEAAKKAGG